MIARLLAWMEAREQRRLRAQQIEQLEGAIVVMRANQKVLNSLPIDGADKFLMRLEANALIQIAEDAIEHLRELA